jgi:hypothetical protein
MPKDRMRAVTLVIAPLMAGAVLLWFQPYSVVSPYQSYVDPARRFLRAALDRDTVGLERQAVARQPVQWALEAGAVICDLSPWHLSPIQRGPGWSTRVPPASLDNEEVICLGYR